MSVGFRMMFSFVRFLFLA